MGTPEFAVASLHAVARTCELVAVVTRPDRPKGRGRQVTESAVAQAARSLGARVIKPERMTDPEVREELAAFQADLFAVVAFGAILAPEILQAPRLGCVNLHGSLLPHYRGASPVQRALWDGCSSTGVTTLWMDEGIDTGDCMLQRWVGIELSDNAGTLSARLADLGAPLLAKSLQLAHAGLAPRQPQERAAGSYAKKLEKRDGMVDWGTDAVRVWNRQRAVTPWPGATTGFRGRRLLVMQSSPSHMLPVSQTPGAILAVAAEGITVACRPGALLVTRVKPDGKPELSAAEWARGARIEPGESLHIEEEAHA